MLENMGMEQFIKAIKCPVLISDTLNDEIIEANTEAEDLFKVRDGGLIGLRVPDICGLTKEQAEMYSKLEPEAFKFDFLPIKLEGNEDEFVLDSTFLENDSGLVRIDTLAKYGENDLASYYFKYEISTHMQQWYPSLPLSEADKVATILRAALFVYGADRAFVIEYDKNIECLEDVHSLFRSGLTDRIDKIRSIGPSGVATFDEMWQNGKPLVQKHYEKKNESELLQSSLYENIDSWAYIIVPFSRQSGIRCFLCIDNVRRFMEYTSVLSNLTNLISNIMFSERLAQSTNAARHLSAELRHMPERAMRIYLLGGIKIETNLGMETDSHLLSSQCGTFFVYLLSNRQRFVPVRELADILWPDEFIDNPYNMIKNVAFRTRKILDSISPVHVIIAGNGTYRINGELDIWLDIEEFERQYKRASDSTRSISERLDACDKAFDLYRGDMLPNFDSERWLINRICYYQLMYSQLIQVYTELLKETNDYMKMFNVVAQATEIEAIDSSVHLTLIKTLVKNRKRSLARQYYGRIKDQLSTEENRTVAELFKTRE